jgi:hypothetical protein
MIFFTDALVPDGFEGYAFGPLAFIRPRRRDDAGLIAHEETHVEQFWRLPIIHSIRYRWDADYRLACELEAYRVQLTHSLADWRQADAALFAEFIATKYDLEITAEAALALLEAP